MAEPATATTETVRQALVRAAARLASTSDTPRLDAELLMAHALETSRDRLLMAELERAAPTGFEALVDRRAACEPVAYIVGHRAFWTIELAVTPAVLIPRPDSETLIEAAVDACLSPPRTILDLGTGSGALLLAALSEWPQARGTGVDRSPTAVATARANAQALGLATRADIREGDWGRELADSFDLILCNPPYIAVGETLPADVALYEPASALFAGADGLDDYRLLMPQIARLLAPQGLAVVEIGHRQADAVCALAGQGGLDTAVRTDLAGRDRAILLRRTKD